MPTIGRAASADAQSMFDLQCRAFVEEARRSGTRDIPPLTESQAAIAQHIADQTALIARLDGALVGAVRGVVCDGVCTVRALVVDPAHHGRGIGSQLLLALERAHPTVSRFDLTTNTLMEGNVPFYERHGYRVTALTHATDRIVLAQMSKPGALHRATRADDA